MGKEVILTPEESEYHDFADSYEAEATNVVLNAFNEGYLLGKKHALREFGGKNED